jgi:metal-responsive CopG/Arc/MetJ family transcriptional regulator
MSVSIRAELLDRLNALEQVSDYRVVNLSRLFSDALEAWLERNEPGSPDG